MIVANVSKPTHTAYRRLLDALGQRRQALTKWSGITMTVDSTQTIAITTKNARLVVIAATIRERNETTHNIPSTWRLMLFSRDRPKLKYTRFPLERPELGKLAEITLVNCYDSCSDPRCAHCDQRIIRQPSLADFLVSVLGCHTCKHLARVSPVAQVRN